MVILVDDLRDIGGPDIICRNLESAKLVLGRIAMVDILYLDHDLGMTGTGVDLLRWMKASVVPRPNEVVLISANPVGRMNMRRELEEWGYVGDVDDCFSFSN